MRTIFDIARKDLMLSLQNGPQILLTIVMPIILMVVLGNAINGGGDVRLSVDVVNNSKDDMLAQEFIGAVDSIGGDTVVTCVYGQDNADACDLDKDVSASDELTTRLEDIDTNAALIIPSDFEAQLLNGETPTIEFRSDNTLNAPSVVNQTIDTAVARVGSSIFIARVGQDTISTALNQPADEAHFTAIYASAQDHWQTAPPIVMDTYEAGNLVEEGTGTGQSVPGTATMFVMISMLAGSAVLVVERDMGTLQRLYTLPVPKYQIVMGKMLAPIAFGLIQFVILIVVGSMIGVEWGNSWLAVALVVIAFVLCGAAMGFVLATLVKTQAQVGAFATFIAMTLAPLGGAWWPLEIVPDFMVIIGHISPIAWAMDAFHTLIFNGGGLGDVLVEVAVLLAISAGLTLLGVQRFSYE